MGFGLCLIQAFGRKETMRTKSRHLKKKQLIALAVYVSTSADTMLEKSILAQTRRASSHRYYTF